MFIAKEAREHVQGFPELLDYFCLAENGVAYLSSGAYLAAWEAAGPDMDSMTLSESWYLSNRIANGLDLGADFGIGCDLIRGPSTEYAPESDIWPDPVSYTIEQERRQQFTTPGNYWSTRYFFYLTYRPATNSKTASQSWVFRENSGADGFAEQALSRFKKRVDALDSLFRANLKSVRRLQCYESRGEMYDDLFRYIRYCIFGDDVPFLLPDIPAHLNQLLAAPFLGGSEPKLHDKYVATIAINGFPKASFAGIFSNLHVLGCKYRFSQQAEILGTQQAIELHDKNSTTWGFKKKSFLRKWLKKDNTVVDPFAEQLESEAKLAKLEAEYRKALDVYYTAKVIVADSSQSFLKEKVQAVLEALAPFQGWEEQQNATAAFISSFPGQMYKDPRQSKLTTQNLAHFLPLHSPYLGLRYNPSPYFPPETPPLLYAATAGAEPYRHHAHTRDVGHKLLAGPVGHGKTWLLGTEIAQWFRFKNGQVFAFDKKKTLYTLTKAMGGDYYDITPDNHRMRFCPLKYIDTAEDRAWAQAWIEGCCQQLHVEMNPERVNAITDAILEMATHNQRSLTDFWLEVSDDEVKKAIRYYTERGPVGGILDGDDDVLSISSFSVFEMDALYRLDPKFMNGILFYLFRRIQKRLEPARATLISVDEFREALHHPVAWKAFDEFLNEGRKLNTCVSLAVQDLSMILNSPLKATILNQCMMRVFLPNPQAKQEEGGAEAYRALGLNQADLEIIAGAQPKRDYYVTSPTGKRVISLDVGKVLAAFLASSDEDRDLVDELIKTHPEKWQAEYLSRKGLGNYGWPDFLEQQLKVRKEAYAYA